MTRAKEIVVGLSGRLVLFPLDSPQPNDDRRDDASNFPTVAERFVWEELP